MNVNWLIRRVSDRALAPVAAPAAPEQRPELPSFPPVVARARRARGHVELQHLVTVEEIGESKRLAEEMDRAVLAALPPELVDIADHYRQGHVGTQPPRWLLTDPTAWDGDVDHRYDYVLRRADGRTQHRGNHTTRMIARAMSWVLSGDPLDSHGAVLDGAKESLARRTREQALGRSR